MTQKIAFLSALTLLLGFVSVFAQKATPYYTEPSLSPDRREIAFVSGGDVWTTSAEGGTAQLLVSHPATESRPVLRRRQSANWVCGSTAANTKRTGF